MHLQSDGTIAQQGDKKWWCVYNDAMKKQKKRIPWRWAMGDGMLSLNLAMIIWRWRLKGCLQWRRRATLFGTETKNLRFKRAIIAHRAIVSKTSLRGIWILHPPRRSLCSVIASLRDFYCKHSFRCRLWAIVAELSDCVVNANYSIAHSIPERRDFLIFRRLFQNNP